MVILLTHCIRFPTYFH